MKRNVFYIGLCSWLLVCVLTGCTNNNYAKQLKQEQKLIKSYISRMGIRVLSKSPDVKQGECWDEHDYVAMPAFDHFYFHLTSAVDTTREVIRSGDVVNVRYRKYGLDSYADTISYWTTDDGGDPLTFTVDDASDIQACPAWHAAIREMKYSGSECKIICPSTAGFTEDNSSVKPYGYDLKVSKRR